MLVTILMQVTMTATICVWIHLPILHVQDIAPNSTQPSVQFFLNLFIFTPNI